MPAEQAGQVSQPENATTPLTTDEPATIAAATQQAETDAAGMMDALGIPKEVQNQVQPKEVETKFGSDIPPTHTGEEEPPPELPVPNKDDEEDEDEEEEAEPAAAEQKPDKRQKRINRLTRQKHELEAKVDQYAAAYEQLRKQVGKETEQQEEAPVPLGHGRLAHVSTDQELKVEVAKAEAIIEWCDVNSEGATTGEGTEKETYHSPADIDRWRREAEKVVLSAPMRREEIKDYNAERQYFDNLAQTSWPQLFDSTSKEYQVAAAILKKFPSIQASPQAQYAVGLVLEGMKAVALREKKPENGQVVRRGDIDSRAFTTPRVPISPSAPNPPSREATPSSQKKLNEAWSKLVADPDGGVENIANAFAALDQADKQGGSDSRTRVRS